jgi:hypothetical protein
MPHWSTTLVSLVGICKSFSGLECFEVSSISYNGHQSTYCIFVPMNVCKRLPAKSPEATLHSLWTHYKVVELTPCCLAETQGLKFRILYNLRLWLLLTVTQMWPLLVTGSNLWVMNQKRADISDRQLSLIMWRDSTLKPMQWAHRTMWRLAYSLAESS